MELTINLPSGDERVAMTGVGERNLKMLRERLGVTISARNGSLRIKGDSLAVGRAARVLEQLSHAAGNGEPMTPDQLAAAIDTLGPAPRQANPSDLPHRPSPTATTSTASNDGGELEVYLRGRTVKAKTPGQQNYVRAIHTHDLTLCCGPAGSGKTYLAVAAAVALLKSEQVRKLVLVRPAVEAGEKLGYLPGSMQEKVNPYLRPLLDALNDMMPFEQIQRFMDNDLIEIVPLAFMRGRTLNDALIILDEAQNTTRSQMLMFLTRLGQGGKMVVTGDTSQIDLEDPRESGLVDAVKRLRRVSGVAMVTLEKADIARHRLVQRIVEAYDDRKDRSGRDTPPPADDAPEHDPPNENRS